LKEGVVLFAHGSRDAEWARPFESLAAELSKQFLVKVAYLELMQPPLGEAVASLAAAGARRIRVVPVFLGQGGHVKEDLPRLVAAARALHPRVEITLLEPIGEQPGVLAAIAQAISTEISRE
jgi:sirohydrochlorin cobaltochelatase